MCQVINNLPIDYDFQSKTKDELKLYAKWFEENKVFLVEFVDEKGDTIGNGMETVYAYQIIRCNW